MASAVLPNKAGKLGSLAWLTLIVAITAHMQPIQADPAQFVNTLANRDGFQGVVKVARNGQVLFQKRYGNAVEG